MGILDNIKNVFSSASDDENTFDKLIEETRAEYAQTNTYFYSPKIGHLESYKKALLFTDKEKIALILHCLKRIEKFLKNSNFSDNKNYQTCGIHQAYAVQLFQSKIHIDEEDLEKLQQSFSSSPTREYTSQGQWPLNAVLAQLERQHRDNPLSESYIKSLQLFQQTLQGIKYSTLEKDKLKWIQRIDKLIFQQKQEGEVKPQLFLGNDEFARFANAMIQSFPDEERKILYRLMEKAQSIKGSKPTGKFLTESKKIIEELGKEKLISLLIPWFDFLVGLKEYEKENYQTYGGTTYKFINKELICSVNAEALKGFVWMSSTFTDTTMLHHISRLAERCFKKIPEKGAAAPALGNGCLYALASAEGLEGIGLLSALKLKVKQTSTQNIILKYLNETAQKHGVSSHEIEDMAADDYGLTNGSREFIIGGYTVRLTITGVGKSELSWIKADGSIQKSVPVIIKEQQAAELKKVKDTQKSIDQSTVAQRERLDRQFRSNRSFTAARFRTYYAEHGLISWIAQRLIWDFKTEGTQQSVFWSSGQWKSSDGKTVELTEQTTVMLWHPALHPQEEVKAWRSFLMTHEISQPLKQAYREIYLLTEAEINTGTYSNRMAAHILKQHQYVSLAKSRNWSAQLQGAWDGGDGTAQLLLPEYKLKAQYWVDGVGGDNDTAASGVWNYVSTDQVRFVNAENNPVELVDIPAIVFSEVMRDVDLFVGVASVGNDPAWQDSGATQGQRDYWQEYSFGELSEVAKNRKEILTGLIPRLKISKVTELKDKYVVVKGNLRTYKIHIGSTNILMEPNDQYLCIVPDRSQKNPAANLFIPFEGDNGLSIILSKAFLLAEDDKITDSTITSQIHKK